MRFVFVFVVLAVSEVTAQEACLEPLRPDAEYLADGGYEGQDMRDAYRGYFSQVEDYLNCLNRASSRIREEATATAQDYNRVLDQYPIQLEQAVEPAQAPRVELSDSGTLFLDYEAKWLQ